VTKDHLIIKKQNRFSIFDNAGDKSPASRRDSIRNTANKNGKSKNNKERRDTQTTLAV